MSAFKTYIEELQNKMQDSRLYIAVLDEVPDYGEGLSSEYPDVFRRT
jgi:hypothetical protein